MGGVFSDRSKYKGPTDLELIGKVESKHRRTPAQSPDACKRQVTKFVLKAHRIICVSI